MSDSPAPPNAVGSAPATQLASGSGHASAAGELRNPHFPCFDAMRAMGMLMVLGAHTHFATIATKKGFVAPFLDRMDFGVTLFFMLSGFLLYRPFVLATFLDRGFVSTPKFLWRRAVRVLPGYWFALTTVVVFFGLTITGVVDFVIFYGLLQPFSAERAFLGIKQSWSLTAEIIFYLMLPPYCFLLRRLGRGRSVDARFALALGGVAVLYLSGMAFRSYFVFAEPSWQARGAIVFPGWVDVIAIGMAMAALSAWMQCTGRDVQPFTWLAARPGAAWAIGWGLFVAISRVSPPPQPYTFTSEFVVRYFVYGLMGLMLLLPAMLGDQSAGLIRRVLRSRVLVWLGTVSLGVYLIHFSVLEALHRRLYPCDDPESLLCLQGNFLLVGGLTFVASVGFAALSYYVVESPFLRMKDRLPRFGRRR